MIPKKATQFYKQVSEDLNLDENLVECFIEFYYKNIRKHLTELNHPRINIEGLGHFIARPPVIRKTIAKNIKYLETADVSTFRAYHYKKSIENRLDSLIKLEQKITEREIKKETFKKEKYERESKKDLEK